MDEILPEITCEKIALQAKELERNHKILCDECTEDLLRHVLERIEKHIPRKNDMNIALSKILEKYPNANIEKVIPHLRDERGFTVSVAKDHFLFCDCSHGTKGCVSFLRIVNTWSKE